MKIIFFGTSSFAARVLAKLIENKYSVIAIVTRPDRMKGRNLKFSASAVKQTALEMAPEVPIFQPEKASNEEFAATLKAFNADLFVVVAYGEIIKKNLLEMPHFGCINIHASLLPHFRGAAPIQRSLMAGVTETGISIIEMTPQMDAGDVLAMEAISVSEDMTFGQLDEQLCALSIKLLFKVLEQFQHGTIVKTSQNHALATFAPKLTAEDEKIDWEKSAEQIHNQIRALSPVPGAWCQIKIGSETKRLKILQSKVLPNLQGEPSELLHFGKEGWIVACSKGALQLLKVQVEGKKAMTAEEFVRGMNKNISMLAFY